MANSTSNLDLLVQSQAGKEVTANGLFDAVSMAALYGRRQSTTSGLTWGYYGGNLTIAGALVQVGNGTVTLAASNTNYLVALKSTGAVSVSTANTNWNNTANYWRLYSIVAGVATVTSYTDAREFGKFAGVSGGGSVDSVNGQTGVVVLDASDVGAIAAADKGAVNGVAPLGADSKVAAAYLPSYVDDVIEVANYAALPGSGEAGKIYITIDDGHQFRWSGTVYVEMVSSPGTTDAVTEGSTNLYFTAQRVRDAVLTGLSLASSAVISATDSVLSALGKLQAQITGKQDALVSGTNIKTINGSSILGSGNLVVSGGTGTTDPQLFSKSDAQSVIFTKTGAGDVSIKAGAQVAVNGVLVTFAAQTAVTMPSLTTGIDYAIYVCDDSTIRADSNMSAPSGYNTTNSRKIGGFHYSLTAAGTTVAGGSFNTAGSPVGGGMVWVQGDVDKIAGINQWSLWDLKFRPACADPRGMVLVGGRVWVDVYLCNTDTATNGTSKAGSNIASGAVLPKVPAAFGGNGTLTYSTLSWWEASELARANQKRLMLASEFYEAAFGVTENQTIDATASTYPTTQRNAGYTSKYGIEQASGHHWTWGQDSAGSASAYAANGGRGQSYNNSVYRVLLGGARTGGANSGSRCSVWNSVSSYSYWNLGLRAACDHVQLV